jgi:endoglycosylceramidase
MVLHGVNANGLQDDYYDPGDHSDPSWAQPFWPIDPAAYSPGSCPTNAHGIVDPPLCEVDAALAPEAQSSAAGSRNDFAQMRAMGFNVVRLTLSWSLLEPTPGSYSTTYLDRIGQVVDWAGQQGIYVVLDMHEDNYSRFIDNTAPAQAPPVLTTVHGSGNHADGAPPWAIVADHTPGLAPFGVDVLNLQSGAAFTSFWMNRPVPGPDGVTPLPAGEAPGIGLQDHYIGAVVALAQRFKDSSTVAGYEIMNEPQSGSFFQPGAFDQGYLYPFYRRVIDAVTGVGDGAPCPASTPAAAACGYPDQGVHDTKHLFFFEPWAVRNLVDASAQVSAPFSTYPNLVYAPHTYTHQFTVDQTVRGITGVALPYPADYDQAFTTAEAEARAMGAALWIGEYGNGSNGDDEFLRAETAAQERHLAGSAVWAWKQNCGTGESVTSCAGSWSTYYGDTASAPAHNLALKPSREKFLSRVVPRATAGRLLSFSFDPDHLSFEMHADGRAALGFSPGSRTEIFVPGRVTGAINVTGEASLSEVVVRPDGNRLVYVTPTGSGPYAVSVAPA